MMYGGTAHNRSVYASPPSLYSGGSGLRFARSWLCHSHANLHPQFASPGLASQALIRAGKPSYTAGTLCEMPF